MPEERVKLDFPSGEPQRLDLFLASALDRLSRSFVQKLIAEGLVEVNGVKAKASRTLQGGERIEAIIPEPEPVAAEPEDIPLSILFEDEHLIAVDKPAGMVVHPAPGHHSGTLVNALLGHCRDLSGIGGALRPGIVHRLDSGTTGVIVAAKNDRSHRELSQQFKDRTVEKSYKALVYGSPGSEEGEIDVAIGRDHRNRKKISAATNRPREALTRYHVDEDFGGISFLTLRLLTGRTHQVRAHLAHIGFPVIGDSLYTGARWRGIADPLRRKLAKGFGRPALHSFSLRFRHPLGGEEILLTAPLPGDMAGLLGELRKLT